jgi:hypothetical protein
MVQLRDLDADFIRVYVWLCKSTLHAAARLPDIDEL